MSDEVPDERWRLVELLQVRALKMFLAGPDGHRLETVDGRIQPMSWRYIPEHVKERIRKFSEEQWGEERRAEEQARRYAARWRWREAEEGKAG